MEEIKMEGMKNEEVKNEAKADCKCEAKGEEGKKCCGGFSGHRGCCSGCGHKWIKGLIILALVLLIFSAGACFGRHENRLEGRGYRSQSGSQFNGSPMMRGGFNGVRR